MEKVYQIMAWTLAAVFAIVVLLSYGPANALTLKKGEVLSSSGSVMSAAETKSGQARIAKDGYLVAAGNLYLPVEDKMIEIPLSELAGKNKAEVKEIITDVAITAFDADGVATEITRDIVDSGALDATIGSDAVFNNMTEAAAEAYEEKIMDQLREENGPDWDGCTGPNC